MKFIYIKKELSPKIFNNQKNVKAIIRKKLIDLAYMYLRNYNLKDIKVLDIRMVGSLCNYNYNASSDLDLHITVDYSKISDNKEFVLEYCKTLRKNWSQNNRIKIYGFPVEIFIEDKSVPMNDKGVYSLLKNKWLNEPKKVSREKINLDDIKSLYIKYKRTIRDLLKSDDINEYNKFSDELGSFRKKGLSSEKGEYSDENIVFKLLRKYKKLDLVTNRKNNLLRRKYTLKEGIFKKVKKHLKESVVSLNGKYNLKNITKINTKNNIDLDSLNNFLLGEGDDFLNFLLMVNDYKKRDYSNNKIQEYYLREAYFKPLHHTYPEELWMYYSFCERGVSINGMCLKYIPEQLKDYNLCKKAIISAPFALNYTPKTIENYYELVKIVMRDLIKFKMYRRSIMYNYGISDEYIPQLKKDFPEYFNHEDYS
jgi:hypothetical protein